MTSAVRRWGAPQFAVLLAIVLLVAASVLVLVIQSDADAPRRVEPPRAAPPEAPSKGQYVSTEVTADGELEVEHWIRTRTPVSSIVVRAAPTDSSSSAVVVQDVEVTAGGEVVARLSTVRRWDQSVALGQSVSEIKIAYRVTAPVSGVDPLDDRWLLTVPTLVVDYIDESGPVLRRVEAAGDILNVACLRAAGEVPRPCGTPSGDAWEVDLGGDKRDVALVVQVQRSS